MTTFVLDEHVGRVFERVLAERGHTVFHAKDRFGERTCDDELLHRSTELEAVFVTNDATDFESVHRRQDHAGIFLYRDQRLPDEDPEGLARAVDEVFDQYGRDGVANRLVELDEWYDWLHG